MDVNAWIVHGDFLVGNKMDVNILMHGDFLVGNKMDVNCCVAFLWVTRWMSLVTWLSCG